MLMSTTSIFSDATARPYFRHDQQFKDRVIASYRHSRETISAVARAHGIRPDLLQRWISDAGVREDHDDGQEPSAASGKGIEAQPGATTFLPIAIEAMPSRSMASICIEMSIEGTGVTVH